MEEKLEWVPEILAIDLVTGRGDDEPAERRDDNCQRCGNALTKQGGVRRFGITGPI